MRTIRRVIVFIFLLALFFFHLPFIIVGFIYENIEHAFLFGMDSFKKFQEFVKDTYK